MIEYHFHSFLHSVKCRLSLDAGFIYKPVRFPKPYRFRSQSYFHWMRVSYTNLQGFQNLTGFGRNPTFTGCGFHIQTCKVSKTLQVSVATLLSLDAGFIYKPARFPKPYRFRSQFYFHWMRVSYTNLQGFQNLTGFGRNPTFTGCGFHIMVAVKVIRTSFCRNPTFTGCGFHIDDAATLYTVLF